MKFSVQNIFQTSREKFLADIWDREIKVVRNPEVCEYLAKLLRLQGVDSVLRKYQGPAMAIGSAVKHLTEDLFDRILVGREKAFDLYQEGCSLELDCAQDSFPSVVAPLKNLAVDLNLHPSTHSKAIIYLSQKGSGFPAHFDGYTNIIFQLTGNKLWRLAPNREVERPTIHYEMSELPEMPPTLGAIWKGPRNSAQIKFESVSLRAGDILFLPRGAWHATEAAEESISLNFTYSVPTLADLASREFRLRLMQDPANRALATADVRMDHQGDWDVAQQVQAGYRQRLWDYQ